MPTSAHVVYRARDGAVLPGTTTALSVLAKPALIQWAWKLGTEGQDYRRVRDSAADVGTLAHYLILCHLRRETPDVSDYPPAIVDLAENAVLAYWEWEKAHTLHTILCEQPLVSEMHRYGGTVDWYGELDGVRTLMDFKTSKAIYDEHYHQLAAYAELLAENSHQVAQTRILRIGRTPDETFDDRKVNNLEAHWTIFRACLDIWYAQKRLKGGPHE